MLPGRQSDGYWNERRQDTVTAWCAAQKARAGRTPRGALPGFGGARVGPVAFDDIVLGAGHNGLTAAAYLARAGRRVLVLERRDHVGGAAVSARVFPGVDARLSRYAYLVSLLPRKVVADLELDITLVRRRYSSYTPRPDGAGPGLLVDTADPAATRESFLAVTGADTEFLAWTRFAARMGRLAERVWPTMLEPLRSADGMRALVDDEDLWSALTVAPLGTLLRDTFTDDLVRGMVATDGLIGTFADLDDPSLAQNVCFLYHLVGGGTGHWDVPLGGMGAVTEALARAAVAAGARVVTGAEVTAVSTDGVVGEVTWRKDGAVLRERAGSVLANVAPAVLQGLLGRGGPGPATADPPPRGAQLKVNLLLRRLPMLRDPGVDPAAAFGGTFHVNEGYRQLQDGYAAAAAGRFPHPVPCEVYCHSLTDRSILGPRLAATDAQTLTVFALHLPIELFRGDHEARRAQALAAVLGSLGSVLGEPVDDLVLNDVDGDPCIEVRTPVDLEDELALPGGNIFHRSLQWPWAERAEEVGAWGVETAHPWLRVCGAGARRGGGVSGIPGHNAAAAVLGTEPRSVGA